MENSERQEGVGLIRTSIEDGRTGLPRLVWAVEGECPRGMRSPTPLKTAHVPLEAEKGGDELSVGGISSEVSDSNEKEPFTGRASKVWGWVRGGTHIMFGPFNSLFSNDLAIDLGTANTLVLVRGKGIVVNEPSVVAVHRHPRTGKDEVLAVGSAAKEMLGRMPGSIRVIRPIQDGVIADFMITEAMLRHFIIQAGNRNRLVKSRIVICVPYGITEVEKRAVRDSAKSAGAREVHLVEEPMAAAIGSGLPISEPSGNMILDIGGGTTEVALISLAGIVFCHSVRIAGYKMDDAIIKYIKNKYNLLIGERTAEEIKIKVGVAHPSAPLLTMEVKGRDLVAGIPKLLEITSEEIMEALSEIINTIVDTVHQALELTPPELASDIVDKGIVLSGGGSTLSHLDVLLREKTGLPMMLAEDPIGCVAIGAGRALDDHELLAAIEIE
jgi:rod shape-determining protein MreB